LTILKAAFEYLTLNSTKQAEKQLRNELVVIFTKIANLYPEALELFMELDIQDRATLFLTHSELEIQDDMLLKYCLV
jgi:hypothetical protein